MKKFALAFAMLLTGCLTATAHASTAVRDLRRQVVSYADLNLESEADAATLSRRIKSAARTVCGVRSAGPMPLATLRIVERCADQATARAVADVNAPLLTRQAMRLDATARPDSRPPVLARSAIEIRNAGE